MQLSNCATLVFLSTYLQFKWQQPDLERPVAVWGGKTGAVTAVALVASITLTNLILALTDDKEVLGLPRGKLVLFSIVTGFGLVANAIWHRCSGAGPTMAYGMVEVTSYQDQRH